MIEVGEYVRTKTGRIYKLGYYNKEEKRWICFIDEDWFPVYESEIAKHSKNIIDLIEVGDYVNGKEICLIDKEENTVIWGFTYKDEQRIFYLYEKDIKSVVTKEQFKNIEYKLEE